MAEEKKEPGNFDLTQEFNSVAEDLDAVLKRIADLGIEYICAFGVHKSDAGEGVVVRMVPPGDHFTMGVGILQFTLITYKGSGGTAMLDYNKGKGIEEILTALNTEKTQTTGGFH